MLQSSNHPKLHRFRGGLRIRMMLVNMIAPLALAIGVLYLGEYRENLIDAELGTLKVQAQLFAGAIAESAIRPADEGQPFLFATHPAPQGDTLSPATAKRIIRRLTENGGSRARVFASDGKLVVDSALLAPIVKETLPPASPTKRKFSDILRSVVALYPTHSTLLPYRTIESPALQDHPDAASALQGHVAATAWRGDDQGDIILSAAYPIKHGKGALGAVLLTRDANDVEAALVEVRFQVLTMFLVALGITILLSSYLAGTIGRPLRRLANAAESIRQAKTRANAASIPDLSHRHDEIGELSLSLRDMTQALLERMDAIDRFAADVAHELKNPLTSLRSAVETVTIVRSEEDRAQLLAIIHHDIQRLDRLISDISSASRLDAELSRDEMSDIDLRRLLNDLAAMHARGPGGASIIVLPGGGEAVVRGNESRLAQVFDNLISNALSFSPPGQPVAISLKRERRTVTATVEDGGPGIPENRLEAIFERFYSERPQHEDYGRHSGLGLSIARQIVSAHNGSIFAENVRGADGAVTGARFSVILEAA